MITHACPHPPPRKNNTNKPPLSSAPGGKLLMGTTNGSPGMKNFICQDTVGGLGVGAAVILGTQTLLPEETLRPGSQGQS